MLKKRDLQECHELYTLITHPDVFPYVRQKPHSYEEFLFMTKQVMEEEERNETISRTILDEWGNPIGTINLYDIQQNAGFLGTWLGQPYHGKGYNHLAKEAFFAEVFFENQIETIYLRIRSENIRSRKAAEKLPYVTNACETRPHIIKAINENPHGYKYQLYEISKDAFTLHYKKSVNTTIEPIHSLEA